MRIFFSPKACRPQKRMAGNDEASYLPMEESVDLPVEMKKERG